MLKYAPLCLSLLVLTSCQRPLAAPQSAQPAAPHFTPRLLSVTRIHDAAPHNAFTDLTRFNNHYYCAFREGSGHVPGTDGVIRVLRSPDANSWTSIAEIKKDGVDLRAGFGEWMKIWGERKNPPLVSGLFVSALANPEFLIEIEATAVISG